MPLIKHSILFIFALSLLLSCNSGRQKKTAAAKSYKTWQTGKLFSDIKVQSDTTLSYALYLPKNYNSKVPNRVMFVFDSHANGLLPVKKYQKLSDKYNVDVNIVLFDVSSSDEVKNGFREIFKMTKNLDIVVNNAGI